MDNGDLRDTAETHTLQSRKCNQNKQKTPSNNILLVKQTISRGGKEERKGNCFDTLPQLAPAHRATQSLTIVLFPSASPAKFSPTFLLSPTCPHPPF